MSRLSLFFALTCLVVTLVTPAQSAAASKAPTTTASKVATPSDLQLQQTISAKLAKSKIGKDGFHFKVLHGVVTWEGSTNVVQHKGSATRMARSAGAAQVVNNIQVSSSGKAKAAASLKKAFVQQ